MGRGGLPWVCGMGRCGGCELIFDLGVASFFNLGEISSIYGGKFELVISENILQKIL